MSPAGRNRPVLRQAGKVAGWLSRRQSWSPGAGRRIAIVVAVALLVLAVDGASKAWARRELADRAMSLGSLDLRLGFNSGVAFGVGAGAPRWLVLAVTGAVVMVLLVVAVRLRPPAAAGLVVGGGVANLLDRAGDGTVTDFLSVGWWPTFNLADSCIVLGAALLVLAGPRSASRPVAADMPQGQR